MSTWLRSAGRCLANATLVALAMAGGVSLLLELASPWPWLTNVLRPRERAELDLAHLATALAVYRANHGRFPAAAEGLTGLVREQILEAVPHDPWGHAYRYSPGSSSYQLRSDGDSSLAEAEEALCFRPSGSPEGPQEVRWRSCRYLLGAEARPGSRAPFLRPRPLSLFDAEHAEQVSTARIRLAPFSASQT
jgi:hypothetical protein